MRNFKQKKTIFSSFGDDFLNDVIEHLDEKEIPLCINYLNSNVQSNLINQNIINARILAREDSIKTHYGNFLDYPLSELKLFELNECRIYFNRTTDRIFLKPQSSRSLDSYFHTLVSFWFFILSKQFEIKSIFFGSSPHFPWDICLFFVAKLLGIKTYILRRTLIEDCVTFDSDFRYGKSKTVKFDKSFEGLVEINQLLKTYQNNSYWLDWSKSMINHSISSKSQTKISFFFGYFTKFNKLIKHFYYELSTNKDTYSQLSKLNYFKFFYKRLVQQRLLLNYWESNCVPFDDYKDSPIVYFPLHFQPERSSDPEAGNYSQQILVIKLLLNLLPEEWKILVKEHPRQNSAGFPNFRRFHYRNISEYDEMFSSPRVVPISVLVPSELVIKHARLTASCTGSIIWEGMLKGKPSISFGSHWHNTCESSPHINDILNGKVSLNALLKKTKTKVKEDVQSFLIDNQLSFIHSSNSSQFASQSKTERNVLIRNLRTSIRILQEQL
tara:strand:- start:308 stop:1801 length:1494 start_codon:yes stop_codon:yes gene_type:complete